MKVIVAGTFTILHDGHKALLDAAIGLGMPIIVGLTDTSFISKSKPYEIVSYEKRKTVIEEYLKQKGSNFTIRPLISTEGDSATEESYTHIVVSEETEGTAKRINTKREKNGLKPLTIVTVPLMLAKDLLPISSRRIIKGEIDEHGSLNRKITFSLNAIWEPYIQRTEEYLKNTFGEIIIRFRKIGKENYSLELFPDNYNIATIEATELLEDDDFSIGISPGLKLITSKGLLMISMGVAIVDKMGRIHFGESQSSETDLSLRDFAGINIFDISLIDRYISEKQWIGNCLKDSIDACILSFKNMSQTELKNQMLNLE